MRTLVFTAFASLAAVAVAAAQPAAPSSAPHEDERNGATLCLDTLGINHPPICHKQSASRFPSPPDICLCEGPWRTVKAPWCAPGEKPPVESAAFDRARNKAAQDGSLFGDTYHGQRMCVPLSPD